MTLRPERSSTSVGVTGNEAGRGRNRESHSLQEVPDAWQLQK